MDEHTLTQIAVFTSTLASSPNETSEDLIYKVINETGCTAISTLTTMLAHKIHPICLVEILKTPQFVSKLKELRKI